jgi:quercetin dioxygenase-like cupin family protein
MGETMRRFLWLILIGLMAGTAAAQDPAAVSPNDYKVEIENQWVRVLRLKQDAHGKTAMYETPASVMVYLTDSDQKFTGADGRAQEARHKAGEVSYSDAVRHAQENLSSEPLEEIIVELKPGAPKGAGLPPASLDPVKVDAAHHAVPLENDHVRVLRTVLEPHLRGPMHAHPHYVVVYLTVLHTTMTLADGKTIDNPRQPGDVAWREPLQHVTENIGDKTAVEIQIELK